MQPEGVAVPLAPRDPPRLTETAGFERGTGFYINPVMPEDAAKILREGAAAGAR